MFNTLKLAKKLIKKIKKSKKYRLLAITLAAKVLISALVIIIVSYLAVNTQNAQAAYGLDAGISQVKAADSATVYYLDHERGLKKAYVSEKAFLSYGHKWSDVQTVSRQDLSKWPEVRLIKSQDSNQVYYISNGQKALIESAEQFLAAGFKWSDILVVSSADLAEYQMADNFKVGGASGNYSNNRLSISLSAASPEADYLAANTQDNLVAVFDLKAYGQPVEITKLTLDLNGIFNPDIIKEVYLTNESDIEYSLTATPSNRQVVFNFSNQPILINDGETRKIKVYINFNKVAGDITNHTLGAAINRADNIGGAQVLGNFPLTGSIFKLISASDSLEKAVAAEQSLSINNNQAVIGSTDKNVGKFILSETSGKSEVFVKELKLTDIGNASHSSLNNFKLKNKAGQVVATAAQLTGDKQLVFKLDNYKIKKGGNETFIVSADIVGGQDSTINFNLSQAKVGSSQGNFNLWADISNLDETITLKRETVGVAAKELKANNKVFTKQAGVIIGNFEIRNNNQKINLNRLNISLEKSANASSLNETVYLVNYNSGEIYATFNGGRFNAGAVSVGLNILDIKAKENLTIALVTEMPDNAPNGSYYKVVLDSIDYTLENGAWLTDAVKSAGAKLTVNKSNLYLYPNNELGEQTFIKGQKNIKIASFIVEGAAGGDTKITGLTFSKGADSSGTISFDNGFSNLKFYIGSTKIKTVKNPYSGDFTIDGFSYALKAGSRAEIKVYADTDSDLQASEIQLAISNLAAVNSKSSIVAAVNNLNVNSHKTVFGQATAEISKVADGFVTKGEDDNVIAAFKIKNTGAEDLKLKSITINAANQELTYSLGYSYLKAVDRDKQKTAGSSISRPVAGANKVNLGGYIVKAGAEAIFDIHVKTDDSVTDENLDIYFSDFEASGKTSKVSALISGDPTDSYTFTIATGSNDEQSGGMTKLIMPVDGRITYGFNDADYPYLDSVGPHSGIDIAMSQGTKVKAAAAGTVIEVFDGGLSEQASYISISHGNGLVTKYVHLSRLDVEAGDKVKQRETIGLSGGTPGTSGAGAYTNGAHLHFEVWSNGAAVDPEKYL